LLLLKKKLRDIEKGLPEIAYLALQLNRIARIWQQELLSFLLINKNFSFSEYSSVRVLL
jgi:hypothetical protein